jgi:hypothetical protein
MYIFVFLFILFKFKYLPTKIIDPTNLNDKLNFVISSRRFKFGSRIKKFLYKSRKKDEKKIKKNKIFCR